MQPGRYEWSLAPCICFCPRCLRRHRRQSLLSGIQNPHELNLTHFPGALLVLPLIVIIPLLEQERLSRVITSQQLSPEAIVLPRQLLDLLKVLVPQLRVGTDGTEAELLRLVARQRRGHSEGVADLAPVPRSLALRVLVVVVVCKAQDVLLRQAQGRLTACLVVLLLCLLEAPDVGAEDALCFCGAETLVVQDQVDSGCEGRVEFADAVGGEEEDAVVVLELAQEHCGKS